MNNTLKSFFISLLPIVSLYYTIDSIVFLINHGVSFRYIGRLLVAGTIAFLFAIIFIKPVARTDANLKIHTAIIGSGLLISLLFGGIIENDLNGSLPSIGLFLGWVLYIKWYSIFSNRNSNTILQVGRQLPDFELQDPDKNIVHTSTFKGNPSIFMFYRGNWCPLCMAQIKEVASQYKELEQRNVNMILVSPQPHGHTRSLAKKFDVNFSFLVDQDNKAAAQLEILSKNGLPMGLQTLGYDSDTVLPTVIITDKDGKIIFADLTDNYRVRPEPETFIKILDQTA